ncbi:MAG: glycosyltransferase [Gemmatimonadaceae bacterium]
MTAVAIPAETTPRKGKPHVLIIPSEEFLPPENHLSGIFQLHQASALSAAGFRVGTLSIRQTLSILMILRAGAYRLAGRKPGNSLDGRPVLDLASLLAKKLTRPKSFVTYDHVADLPVVRVEGFYLFPPSRFTDHLGWVRAGVAAFEEYCDRCGRPDLLHAHNLNPAGLLGHRISRRYNIPFVLTEHSTFYGRGLVPRSLFSSLRRAADAASGLAVVSPALGTVLQNQLNLNADSMRWIPNVIDPDVASMPVTRESSSDDGFTFLCIGNLIPVKNHAVLLKAFQTAFHGQKGMRLRIGGDGPLELDLKVLAAELKIAPQIQFLGRLSREQVVQELDRCNAFVLPSSYETFGVVLIEALVRGKPVIATRCGGPESFVGEEDGIIVPPDGVTELATALRTMSRQAASYDSDTLRQRALARFGAQKLVQNLENFYFQAMRTNA